MFKRDNRMVSYHWDGVAPLPDGLEVGAYEYDGDQWQWTREI